MKTLQQLKKIKSHPVKVLANKYPGGETEKSIWQMWFYIVAKHGLFLRKTNRKRLFNAFTRGVEAAKQDKDKKNPYLFISKRSGAFDCGRLFYRYFLKQALDLRNTPQAFRLDNLINDAIDERHIA